MNSLLLDAIRGNNLNRPPVWIMRQAGRYMPSYQALRKSHSLGTLFRNPDLIKEVTLLPIDELGVDAAIIFSDILLLFETLEAKVHYPEKETPWIEFDKQKINEPMDLQLAIKNLDRLDPLYEGIQKTKADLHVPLIGFCGAPFTLLSYLLDREDRKTFPNTFHFLLTNPVLFKRHLDDLSSLLIHFARKQIEAGVNLFQVFESSGAVLSAQESVLYSIPYLQKMTTSIDVPCISFIKGSSKNIDVMKTSLLPILSFDHALPMKTIRSILGKQPILQGNLDPLLLFEEESIIEEKTLSLLESMKNDPGFILNLGHGILPGTPYHNVKRFVQTAKNFLL